MWFVHCITVLHEGIQQLFVKKKLKCELPYAIFFKVCQIPINFKEEKDNCPNDSICLGTFQQCMSYASVWLAGCWFWCGLMLHFERLWVMKQDKSISPCHVFAFSACVCKRACQRDWVEAAVINDVLIPSLVWSDSLWNGCLYVQMWLNVCTIVC